MKNISYYLSCGYCCGCIGSPSENKRLAKKKKKENLENLEAIKRESKSDIFWNDTTDPMNMKTEKMTQLYTIPNKDFATEKDVIQHLGYQIDKKIDSGSFGTIMSAIHLKSKLKIAIKVIRIPEPLDKKSTEQRNGLLKDVKHELFVLSKIRHPHVVKLIHHLMIKSNLLTLYILIEFAENGNLEKFCLNYGTVKENECKRWFAQMLSGLSFMHKKGIAHRDLKLSNILLDSAFDVLISDFGLSRVVWRNDNKEILMFHTYCGTPPYLAPEVLMVRSHKNPNREYNGFKADVWSLGVILYVLLCNMYPFPQRTKKAVKYMKKKVWKYPKDCSLSIQLQDFLKTVFEPNPSQRPTMEKLQDHIWIKDNFKAVNMNTS